MADHKRNCLFACIQRVVDCSQKIMLTNFFRPVLLCYKKLLKYIQNITYTQVGTYIINSSLSNDVSRIFFLISLSKSKYLSLFLIRRSREDSSGANLIKVLMLSSSYEYNDADEVGTENVEWRKRHRRFSTTFILYKCVPGHFWDNSRSMFQMVYLPFKSHFGESTA